MKNILIVGFLVLTVLVTACDTELGHTEDEDHDHDGDGVEDHTAEEHVDQKHDDDEFDDHKEV